MMSEQAKARKPFETFDSNKNGETACVGKEDDPSQKAFLALLGDSDVT